MTQGTPFILTDGQLLAVCFHLDTTSRHAQTSKFVMPISSSAVFGFPCSTLVTSGPTYSISVVRPI